MIYIKTNTDLCNYCEQWSTKPAIALDAEFLRTETFFPLPAIYQVYDGSNVYIIDALLVSDFSAFIKILCNRDVVKVLHGISEDFQVLLAHFGDHPFAGFFDTQLAYSFISDQLSVSYAALVEKYVGDKILKSETRSNWLKRPLTDEQLSYAEQDVLYSLQLYACLSDELENVGRSRWFWDEMQCKNITLRKQLYFKFCENAISHAFLPAFERHLFEELWGWRDNVAICQNCPASWVIKDKQLLKLARKWPMDKNSFRSVLNKRQMQYCGELEALHSNIGKNFQYVKADYLKIDNKKYHAICVLSKEIMEHAQTMAEKLAVHRALLLNQRALLSAIYMYSKENKLSEGFSSWRYAIIGRMMEEKVGGIF